MDIHIYTEKIRRLDPSSHKGQNGKVMIIGGSELFHAASKWALDTVAGMVDMVFYSSVPENNELIHEAKQHFWSGVVVPRGEVENYIDEADVILIGPGMTRDAETKEITERLLSTYSHKKWVVDAGALQMVDPELLTKKCIITPHKTEFVSLAHRAGKQFLDDKVFTKDGEQFVTNFALSSLSSWTLSVKNLEEKSGEWIWYEEDFEKLIDKYIKEIQNDDDEANWTQGKIGSRFVDVSALLHGCTVLRKGIFDCVARYDKFKTKFSSPERSFEMIPGGNAGMTKGGTGDVLAGLVAGLYAFSDDPFAVAVVASYVNKAAGDELYKSVGPFFTTNQLVEQIPKTLKEVLGY